MPLSMKVNIQEEDHSTMTTHDSTMAVDGVVISLRFDLRNCRDPGKRATTRWITVLCRFIQPRKASARAINTRVAGKSATMLKYEIPAASRGTSCFIIIRLAEASDRPNLRKKYLICLEFIALAALRVQSLECNPLPARIPWFDDSVW